MDPRNSGFNLRLFFFFSGDSGKCLFPLVKKKIVKCKSWFWRYPHLIHMLTVGKALKIRETVALNKIKHLLGYLGQPCFRV